MHASMCVYACVYIYIHRDRCICNTDVYTSNSRNKHVWDHTCKRTSMQAVISVETAGTYTYADRLRHHPTQTHIYINADIHTHAQSYMRTGRPLAFILPDELSLGKPTYTLTGQQLDTPTDSLSGYADNMQQSTQTDRPTH